MFNISSIAVAALVIDSASLLLLRRLWSHFSPNPLCWYIPQCDDTVAVMVWAQSQMREEDQPDWLMELERMGQALVTGVLRWDSDLKLSTAEHFMAIQICLPLTYLLHKGSGCLQGRVQAAGGEIILPFGSVGVLSDWTWRLGLRNMYHRASNAAEFVFLQIWRWSFWFQTASLLWLESVLKKVAFSSFPKEAHFPFAIWNFYSVKGWYF